MDENVSVITRRSYNLIDALTNTGGFASIIMIIFKILTLKIQKTLFEISIIKKIFYRNS